MHLRPTSAHPQGHRKPTRLDPSGQDSKMYRSRNIPSLAQLQDTLRKETEIPTTSMENSVHELPANLRKEALSGVYGTVEISA